MGLISFIFNFNVRKSILFIREWFIGAVLLGSFIILAIYNNDNKVIDNYSIYKKGEEKPELVGKLSLNEMEEILKEPYRNKNLHPGKTFYDRTGNIHHLKDGTRVEIVEIYNYPIGEYLDPGAYTFRFYFLFLGFRLFVFFLLRKSLF